MAWLRALGSGFWRDARGGIAAAMALALPVLVLAAGGAVELQSLQADRAALQSVADASALWGARQLVTNPVGVETQTRHFASPQLSRFGGLAKVRMSVATKNGQTLTVALDAPRPSLVGALMSKGAYTVHVQSTAQALNSLPLCVQVFGPQPVDQLLLSDGATATATNCLVHAKGAINVQAAGDLSAGAVETESSTAAGQISPQALTGAPPLADPFARLAVNFPQPCAANPGPAITVGAAKPVTLTPNAGTSLVVQSAIQFDGTGGTLTLAPGEYYFCQSITAMGGLQAIQQQTQQRGGPAGLLAPDSAQIVGDDVTMIFADGAKLMLGAGASLNVTGRQTGPLAGFVLIAGLAQPNNVFTLRFDQIQSLLGAVYVRQGLLDGQGVYRTTSSSAWTAVVANQFTLHRPPPGFGAFAFDSTLPPPKFAFAANFVGSSVPRPPGIGDNTQLALDRVRLVN